MNALILPPEEHLPPEFIIDPFSPLADKYLQTISRLKMSIVSVTRDMKPRHVEIVKQLHIGKANRDIAEDLKVSAAVVSNVKRRADSIELLSLLQLLTLTQDSPSLQQRQNMLWRIATRNEESKPNVAISAINGMASADDRSGGGEANVTVIINNNVLAKSALDI